MNNLLKLLLAATTLMMLVAVPVSASITPIIKAVSPSSPIYAVEGDVVAFDAYIDSPPLLPIEVEWFYDGVRLHNESFLEGSSEGIVVFWTTPPLEAGTHEVMLIVTAIDETNATHEWTVTVAEAPERATIYVTIFHDLDGDGLKDPEDFLLPNWTVVLNNSRWEASATTSEGWIYFEADTPQEISASIIPPEGRWNLWRATTEKTLTLFVVAGDEIYLAFGVQTKKDDIASPGNAYGHDKEKKLKK